MPPKTFTCVVCSNEVSKRKSLAFGKGRACRDHEEVQAAIKQAEEQAEAEKLAKNADEAWTVITMAEKVRVLHSVRGVPLSVLYGDIRQLIKRAGADDCILDKIKAHVDERGAVISAEEMQESMMSWLHLNQMANEKECSND